MWKVIPFELVPPADTIRDGLAGMDMSRWHGKNQAAGSYIYINIMCIYTYKQIKQIKQMNE